MKRRNFFKLMSLGGAAAFWRNNQNLPNLFRTESSMRKSYSSPMDPSVEVDLSAIEWNFRQLRKKVGLKIMAVVKANAYGHGLIDVSKCLEKAGADGLMVGKLEEAISLRQVGLKCLLLNFGPFERQDAEAIIQYRFSQSVFTDEVFFLEEAAAKKGLQALVHVDIDTGMGRTGVPYERALAFIEKIASSRHLRLEGIATTLTEDPDFDREQVRRLNEVYTSAKQKGINCGLRHAASSAGLLSSPDLYLDMVRPGITIYGYYPNDKTQKEDSLSLRPVLRLKAKVIFIRDLQPGETLSYHRVFKAESKMRVATLGLGYSDGYQAQFGGRGWAIIKGQKFPVLPLITANHLMIDLQNNTEIKIGDEAILIDSEKNSPASAATLAEASGVSTYRILIGLNPLLPRSFS